MTGKRSGKLAFCGVMTALALVFLLLTLSPAATVALAALAAVCGIPVVVEVGKRAALLHYGAVAVLALLLVPALEGKALYIAFFGWYTVFKAWLESKHLPRLPEYAAKLAIFTVAGLVAGALLWKALLAPLSLAPWLYAVGVVAACGAFFLYDWGVTRLVSLYALRLHPPLSRLFRF